MGTHTEHRQMHAQVLHRIFPSGTELHWCAAFGIFSAISRQHCGRKSVGHCDSRVHSSRHWRPFGLTLVARPPIPQSAPGSRRERPRWTSHWYIEKERTAVLQSPSGNCAEDSLISCDICRGDLISETCSDSCSSSALRLGTLSGLPPGGYLLSDLAGRRWCPSTAVLRLRYRRIRAHIGVRCLPLPSPWASAPGLSGQLAS